MISRGAVLRFLRRKLSDHDWLKECTHDDIMEALDQFNLKPKFHTKPFLHQMICFYIGVCLPEFVLLLDMGLGKTKIILDILAQRNKYGEGLRPLILVPNLANLGTWVDEAAKHRPDFKVLALEGSSGDRWRTLKESGADGFALNYQGLVAMIKGREDVERLLNHINSLIFDESTALKNWRSKTYKICNWMAPKCKVRYALTGTPFGRDPQDLWAQFHAVDGGASLGFHIGMFRAAFFKEKIDYFGHYHYELDKEMEPELNRTLRHRSIRYRAEECLGLPEKVYQVHRLEFPSESLAYYERIKKELRQALAEETGSSRLLEVRNAFLRARMISSGFLAVRVGDEEERLEIEFDFNPKLDALKGLIEAMPVDQKMVVFHDFIFTGGLIEKLCKEMKVTALRLYGATKDKPKVVRSFQEGKARVLAMNSRSGAMGLNLQVANHVVFFESPVSPIVRQQAEKRCHRTGQKRTVFFHDLVVKGSSDEKILSFLKEGKDLLDGLLSGGADL